MPDPISSSSSQSSSYPPDPTLDDSGQVCRDITSTPAAPLVSEPPPKPPAVAKLIHLATPPTALPPPSVPPSEAENNSQRTSERTGATAYADAGITGGARDALFAGAAFLKGHDASGIDVEVFSASGQIGGEQEAQIGMARVGVSGKYGNASGEVFTLRANGGAHNDDGSTGFNAGIIGTFAGAEGTVTDGADSLTVGVSAGLGLAISTGIRDLDNNGVNEWCGKVSVGPLTLGACWEGS